MEYSPISLYIPPRVIAKSSHPMSLVQTINGTKKLTGPILAGEDQF